MDSQLTNMLYRRPELYESVYDGSGDVVPRMCERLFERHLGGPPASVLDIGCGTGRDLAYLAATCSDCVGVDYQQSMIAYAQRQRPQIDFRVGDMTSLRLGRTFEAITCFGHTIANVHSNADVSRAIATFAAHAAAGTLLILDAINALRAEKLPHCYVVDTPGFKATAEASYEDDRRHQLLIRRREWVVEGEDTVEDFARFRTLAPLELEHHLALHGFETLAIYDNDYLEETDLGGSYLVAVARFARDA